METQERSGRLGQAEYIPGGQHNVMLERPAAKLDRIDPARQAAPQEHPAARPYPRMYPQRCKPISHRSHGLRQAQAQPFGVAAIAAFLQPPRSEDHNSELQYLMRIPY